MSMSVGVGGAWKTVAQQYVGVSGAWKTVQNVYVGVSGAWKQAYANYLQQVTVGVGTPGGGVAFGYSDGSFTGAYGSISVGTFIPGTGNFAILQWFFDNSVNLRVSATGNVQSCFTNMNVNGTDYTSASASFTDDDGSGNSSWTWSSGSNPFGTSGSKLVTFT